MRYHGLDFTRAILMMLGVVIHSSVAFAIDVNSRAVLNHSNGVYNIIIDFIHIFRMSSFYLLSGFFFTMLVERKTYRNAIKNRMIVLGVPLIFAGATINTLLNLTSHNFDFNTLYRYIVYGEWLAHLWFIGNLIIYCIISYPLVKYSIINKTKIKRLKKWMIVFSYFLIPIFTIFLKLLSQPMYSETFMFVDVGLLFYHYSYFAFGILIWHAREEFFRIANIKNSTIAIIATVSIYLLSELTDNKYMVYIADLYIVLLLSFSIISMLNLLGKRGYITSFLSSCSYTVYLLHPLMINILVITIGDTLNKLNVHFSFFILVTLCLILTITSHYLIIEKVRPLKFLLNGKNVKKSGGNQNPTLQH
ncbi:hypothetical protein RN22_15855 [Grimontia sp. AD028]|uniref:acyltransferase family protein n=1 Tax=Grimontia sp. AD028 TaxID=1581149 RepID=UPI00061B487B|nr:hypothetical protein RN22_15855 [Grimontia sp. AD028]